MGKLIHAERRFPQPRSEWQLIRDRVKRAVAKVLEESPAIAGIPAAVVHRVRGVDPSLTQALDEGGYDHMISNAYRDAIA